MKNSQRGQVLLIVVLAAVVSLTVGLSAVSRTITNTKVSTEEANSQKALSAAEAGIEKLLNNASLGQSGGTLSNNANFSATTTQVRSDSVELNGGNIVAKDDGADVWLSNSDFSGGQWSGTLTVYWNGGCSNSALEIVTLSGVRNNPAMARSAYDACSSRGNNFQNPSSGGTINGKSYSHSFSLDINNGFIARIIPIYADTAIAVRGSSVLPPQGDIIESVGTSGNTSRKVRVYKGYPRVPIEFFPYNIFLPL